MNSMLNALFERVSDRAGSKISRRQVEVRVKAYEVVEEVKYPKQKVIDDKPPAKPPNEQLTMNEAQTEAQIKAGANQKAEPIVKVE